MTRTEISSTAELEDGGPLVALDGEEVRLAGNKMVIEDRPDGSLTVRFDDRGTGRTCGSGNNRCTLCCRNEHGRVCDVAIAHLPIGGEPSRMSVMDSAYWRFTLDSRPARRRWRSEQWMRTTTIDRSPCRPI
jgi:hypothetical protein